MGVFCVLYLSTHERKGRNKKNPKAFYYLILLVLFYIPLCFSSFSVDKKNGKVFSANLLLIKLTNKTTDFWMLPKSGHCTGQSQVYQLLCINSKSKKFEIQLL